MTAHHSLHISNVPEVIAAAKMNGATEMHWNPEDYQTIKDWLRILEPEYDFSNETSIVAMGVTHHLSPIWELVDKAASLSKSIMIHPSELETLKSPYHMYHHRFCEDHITCKGECLMVDPGAENTCLSCE